MPPNITLLRLRLLMVLEDSLQVSRASRVVDPAQDLLLLLLLLLQALATHP